MKQIADRLGDDAELLGFVKLDAEPGAATHAVLRGPDSLYFAALTMGGGIYNDSALGVTADDEITLKTGKRRGGGEWAILGFPDSTIIVGLPRTAGRNHYSMHKSVTSTEYDLVVKYTGLEDERLAFDPVLFPENSLADYNGDGIEDMLRLRGNGSGIPIGVSVLDGDNFDEIWSWDFPAGQIGNILSGFHGFADVDGDGSKEMLCGNNLVVFSDGSVQEIEFGVRILHLMDVDNDGLTDIVGRNQVSNRILALGVETPTSVLSESVPESGELMTPFPNPFSTSGTFRFSLEKEAHIQLEIFDVLGRRVRSLLNETRNRGMNTIMWDGTSDAGIRLASGTYFARLSTPGNVAIKAFLITR